MIFSSNKLIKLVKKNTEIFLLFLLLIFSIFSTTFYNNKKLEYQIIPVMESNEINYVWEIPLPFKFLKSKIPAIIDEAIENNDETNLEVFLQNKNLILGNSLRIIS